MGSSKEYIEKNKVAIAAYQKVYKAKNKAALAAQQLGYTEENKERIAAYKKTHYQENREEIAAKGKAWREKNKEKLIAYDKARPNRLERNANNKAYAKKNRGKINANNKIYREENREEIAAKARIAFLALPPLRQFTVRVRSNLSCSIRKYGYKKNSSTEKLLGASHKFVRAHLLKTGRKNYGADFTGDIADYDIDHIIPLASAKTEAQLLKLLHWGNLQLLTPSHNLTKRDSLDWVLPKD